MACEQATDPYWGPDSWCLAKIVLEECSSGGGCDARCDTDGQVLVAAAPGALFGALAICECLSDTPKLPVSHSARRLVRREGG